MPAIRTEDLTKRYGATLVLDSLNLEVHEGEVYGYLGPNGAGKTTTIRLLLGLHRSSEGRAELFGVDSWGDPVAAHRRVAYVAGEPVLWPSLTSAETFEFLARVHGGTDVSYRAELVERFQLDTRKKVRALSKGNRQKVQLVAPLATRADLLLLDEPTAGLDPLMEVTFRECVEEGKERGQSVFLSSHILSEVPRLRLLSSPVVQALRSERGSLIAWLSSVGAFGIVMGVVSKSVSSAAITGPLSRELRRLGAGSVLTPTGYLGFAFIFFVLAAGLFACSQIAAVRHEEADERLETLLALPVSRRGWLGGRLMLGCAGLLAVAAVASVLTWLGAVSQGVDVSLPRMLEAGVNCLPVGIVFLGLGALAYALAPRASAGIAYGLAAVAFLWYLTGALLGAPRWLVDLSPFRHVGLVPAQGFRPVSALVMMAIGALAALISLWAFERRDLVGA